MTTVTGITKDGFEYTFDKEALDDMRFVDTLAVVVDPGSSEFEQIAASSELITMMLGKEQKKKLYAHIGRKHANGRVPVAELKEELEEIMSGAGDTGKN